MSLSSSYTECIDLICSCMERDPDKRIALEMILCHDWFQTLILNVKPKTEAMCGRDKVENDIKCMYKS